MTKPPSIAGITLRLWFMGILLLFALPDVTLAQDLDKMLANSETAGDRGTTPASHKVSSSLRAVMDEMKAQGITRHNARVRGASALSSRLVRVNQGGAIQTYIRVYTFGETEEATLRTYEINIEIANQELGIIQAWLPLDRMYQVAQLPFVRRITPPSYAVPRKGSVTTEGDAIHRADEVRALGFDGSGIKIGVISDGVDSRAAAQATDDLPQNITIVTYAGNGDEGTAMLEIIHDMAPGAELLFCGPGTSLEFIECENDLAAGSAAIIVDDLGFPAEPYFEDGPVAQAVSNAIANGKVHVSAAGNDAQQHYEDDFAGATLFGLGVAEHDFGVAAGEPSDGTMDVLVDPSDTIEVYLQWNDQFGISGNNYDLFLFDETETIQLASSKDIQDGDDDPFEALSYTNPDPYLSKRVKVVVAKINGADRFIELFLYGEDYAPAVEEYNVPDGSIIGHPAVVDALAIGAIDANDPGHDHIEGYSSLGPCRIFFPKQETRQKPNFAGIDNVSVTGAGGFGVPVPGIFPGTSAAAPHIGAIFGLLMSASKTPDEVVAALEDTAVDLGDPGPDNTYGVGRVDAFAAAQQSNRHGPLYDPVPSLLLLLVFRPSWPISIEHRGSSIGSTLRTDGVGPSCRWPPWPSH